jgi:hypothetical protein
MSAVRHVGDPDLIADVIERDMLPVVRTGKLAAHQRAGILLQLAATFEDVMDVGAANAILAQVQLLVPGPFSLTGAEHVLILRRRAISHLIEDQKYPDAETFLKEAIELAADIDSNALIGVHNTLAWLSAAKGRFADAAERLQSVIDLSVSPTGEAKRLIVAPWNALETSLTSYSVHALSGANTKRLKEAEERLSFQVEAGITKNVLLRPIAHHLSTVPTALRSSMARPQLVRVAQGITPQSDGLVKLLNSAARALLA